MLSSEELKRKFAAYSTIELFDILENENDYTERGIKAARAELLNRNVSEEDRDSYKEIKIQEEASFIKKNISEDLTVFEKIRFYIFWIPIVNFAYKQNYREDGFVLKLKQANYYSLTGLVFFIISAFIQIGTEYPVIKFLLIWIAGFLLSFSFDEKFNREILLKRIKKIYGHKEDLENHLDSIEKET
jgi:hypothetical protein